MRAPTLAIGSLLAGLVVAVPGRARAEDDELVIIPVTRVVFGPAFHVGDSPLVQTLVDVDAGVFFLAGQNQRYYFDAELGYTFDNGGLHAFNLMAAIGYGRDHFAYVAYQPRLVLGTIDHDLTVGMRNGIGGHFFSDMLNLELGHQFVSTNGRLSQSITATAGTNPAAVIFLVLESLSD